MSNPTDFVKKTLRENIEAVLTTNEGKLPLWLEKKNKKGKEDEMEEAKKVVKEKEEECSCKEDDDLPWCDDCEEDMEESKKIVKEKKKEYEDEDEEDMEEAKKVVKEEECSCKEDDDLPWCDDCENKMEEAKKPEPTKIKEHLAPLFDGQKLSEDFKTKIETIFGAVIAERETAIKEHYEAALEEAVANQQSDLAEKVDEYLSYVVEEWYKENKIALERSLRAEIAENFIEGLRNLFTDNFITIPEDKVDVLEAANTKIDELTTQVNEEIVNGMEKAKRIEELEAKIAFSESVDGLTLSEVEKLKELSKSIEFDTIDEFKTKLNVLKETYLKTPVQETRDTLVEDSAASQDALLSPTMQAYTRTLSKFRN
jgi:uncharacterized coiled-coil protein SlyX